MRLTMVAVVVEERLLLGHLEQAQRAEQVGLEQQIALQVLPLLMPEAAVAGQQEELLALEVLVEVVLDQLAEVWLGLLALITQAVVVVEVRIPVLFLFQLVVKAAPVS